MNQTSTLEREACDFASDSPLELSDWLSDGDFPWNSGSAFEDDDSLQALGLSEFDPSTLQPEELDFLLVSLGAAASFSVRSGGMRRGS
jgi:hypothetical protein